MVIDRVRVTTDALQIIFADGVKADTRIVEVVGGPSWLKSDRYDLNAKADSIELTGLSPYSTKYTGYPIVKGTLTVDVHYLLNQGELTANNHIFIDQFTFGDRVESSTATNLPVRFRRA